MSYLTLVMNESVENEEKFKTEYLFKTEFTDMAISVQVYGISEVNQLCYILWAYRKFAFSY